MLTEAQADKFIKDCYRRMANGEQFDIHTERAALEFDVPTDMVTKEQRQFAKMRNHAIFYRS